MMKINFQSRAYKMNTIFSPSISPKTEYFQQNLANFRSKKYVTEQHLHMGIITIANRWTYIQKLRVVLWKRYDDLMPGIHTSNWPLYIVRMLLQRFSKKRFRNVFLICAYFSLHRAIVSFARKFLSVICEFSKKIQRIPIILGRDLLECKQFACNPSFISFSMSFRQWTQLGQHFTHAKFGFYSISAVYPDVSVYVWSI